jgi:hypothetical protein
LPFVEPVTVPERGEVVGVAELLLSVPVMLAEKPFPLKAKFPEPLAVVPFTVPENFKV